MKIFDSSCTRCILHHAAKSVCIPSDGPDDADILFYGEAPGADEDEANRPFVGPAGEELNSLLKQAGLSRKRVRISNVGRCRPPSNRAPTKEEIDACSFYTVREIAKVKPKVIVALGVSALKALTGAGKVGDNRGRMLKLLPDYRSDVPVLATYHPAAYLHNPAMRAAYSKAIVEDIRLAQRVASGSTLDAKIVTSLHLGAAVQRTLRRLAKCEFLTCDLEWEVLPSQKKDPVGMWPWSRRSGRVPRPVSIAIAGEVDGSILALGVPLASEYAKTIRCILKNVPTGYHHAMADLIWLYHLGWEVMLGDDTFILASLIGVDGSLSLKVLAPTLTDMPPGWETTTDVGKMPVTKDEWRRLLRYNAMDAIATLKIRQPLRKMLREAEPSPEALYGNVLLPAVQVLVKTALNGTPVDEVLLKKMRSALLHKRAGLAEQIGDTLGLPSDYEAIIGSGQKLAPYLERIGIKLPRTKKTDRPSVTNDVLLQNKAGHEVIPTIIDHRKLSKRESSYYRPWRWLLETQRDGRLHTVYRLTVASTGRSSAESEAGNTFQQFPRGEAIRKLIKAKPGWRILSVDQSQIELRLIAWQAHERRMLQFFKEGRDLHTAMAGWIKALDAGWTVERYLNHADRWVADVTKEERFGAKAVNFGLGYGGGPSVVQRTARRDYGITLSDEQAETAYQAYHLFYPDIRPWQETFWRDVQRGYGTTPLGRHRSVSEDSEGPEGVWRKYINLPIQATASDLSLFCMDYMWELLYKAFGKSMQQVVENIGFFHDAALLHLDRQIVDTVEEIVKEAWEHPPLDRIGLDLPVPLVADIHVGRRWIS